MIGAPPSGAVEPSGGEQSAQPPKSSPKHGSFLRELPFLLAIGLVVVVVLRAFLVQAFYIPSASMELTLLCNDRVLVNRQAYALHGPSRQDVVVFHNWSDVGSDVATPSVWQYVAGSIKEGIPFFGGNRRSEDLIKRVIGLPGDTVQVRNSHAYVDGKALDEPYIYVDGRDTTADFGPVKVPPGDVFVMGDHRNDSADSRRSGPVDVDAVVGRAFVRIWPPGRLGGLRGPPSGAPRVPNC